MKKNINIQLLRIFSMFMILMCHFCNEIGNKYGTILGQMFNVGVYIFLFISGYLFGKKDINDVKKWYFKRAIRIFVPLWIWTIIVNLIYIIIRKPELINLKSIIAYTLNLQGFFGGTQGLEHLWFLTLIMICYLITPLLEKFREKSKSCIWIMILTGILISIGISFIDIKIGRYIFECLLYIFAYYYSYNEIHIPVRNPYIYAFGGIIVSMAIRFIGQKFFDNTIIYSNVIVLITQSVIAICYFTIFKNIKINIKKSRTINIINYFDKISFYMYIVHYIFCVGPIDMVNKFSKLWIVEVLITLVISYVLSGILSMINDFMIKRINLAQRL